MKAKQFEELRKIVLDELGKDQSFENLFFLSNVVKRIDLADPSKKSALVSHKVALIGGVTLYPLSDLLALYAYKYHLNLTLWIGEFDNYKQEVIDKNSDYNQFAPDTTIVFPESVLRNRGTNYGSSSENVMNELKNKISFISELLGLISINTGGETIIFNEALPHYHDLGHSKSRFAWTDWSYVKKYNTFLSESLPDSIHIIDVEFLSVHEGGKNSFDSKFYYETKNLYSPNFLGKIADETIRFISNIKKPIKKCLVCDLDNTLWGGIIGDDGIEGIELDEVTARGLAFKEFQKKIKDLKNIGVVLAISSKNEESIALNAINNHPDMILREEDFVSIKINWNPKSDNIFQIAKDLNIGTDSLVFIDDNPAEIEIVNQFLPEVSTITLGHDPTKFISLLKNSRLFEPKTITSEDTNKTEQYQQEFKRKDLQSSVTDIDSYLKSLEMSANFNSFSKIYVSRVAQLTQKSNQFNLTTRRRSESEILEVGQSKDYFFYTTHVQDKFGDYGLIGVNIFAIDAKDKALVVDTWLMSCRVLKRGVEEEVLNYAIKHAHKLGLSKIVGIYYPTKKNIIVKDLYANLGFTLIRKNEEEEIFELNVRNAELKKTYLAIKDEEK